MDHSFSRRAPGKPTQDGLSVFLDVSGCEISLRTHIPLWKISNHSRSEPEALVERWRIELQSLGLQPSALPSELPFDGGRGENRTLGSVDRPGSSWIQG